VVVIVSARVSQARRGLVAGIVCAGAPLGQLLLAPSTQGLIAVSGWVTAAVSVAALSLVALPLAFAFRRAPGGTTGAGEAGAVDVRTVLASRTYWMINATFFVCGLHVFFLITHLPGVIEACGLSANVSAAALALLGLFNIAGSIGAGWAIQRWSMKGTLALLFASRAAGIALFLAAPKTEAVVLAFSVWMGFTYMAVLPPTAGLIGRHFGTARLATLLGITFMVHQVGAFLGSWLGGVVLESTGSYDPMWVADLALAVVAAGLALVIPEGPAQPRPAPLSLRTAGTPA